ncbi:sulfonate ABC transporter permease, partial [Acinetobacter baumannii]
GTAYGIWLVAEFVLTEVSYDEVLSVVLFGFYTLVRVFVLIVIASLVWVPIGVWIGLNPRLTQQAQPIVQFLAAFPANLVFPIAVILMVKFNL